MRVDAHAVAARGMKVIDLAGGGDEALGVFGVDAAFHGVTTNHDILLADRQGQTSSNVQLLFDDVDASNHLGHRVLNLHAGVHLNEVEVAVFIEELERASAAVADFDTGAHAAFGDFFAGLFVDVRGWGFFDHLLVAALQRAVAVA